MSRTLKAGLVITLVSAALLSACAGKRPDNLGVKDGLLAACPGSPNCVSSQRGEARHRIAPLSFSGNPDAAMERLRQLLSRRSDTTYVAGDSGYLRVEFRTRLFVDDGEFLLDPGSRVIHVRSAARLGYWDLGKNRRRLDEIRPDFEKGVQ